MCISTTIISSIIILHQKALDEVIAAEAYLELFLRRLTEPSMIGLFLRFIVASTDDSDSVLSSLISRLGANSTVSVLEKKYF